MRGRATRPNGFSAFLLARQLPPESNSRRPHLEIGFHRTERCAARHTELGRGEPGSNDRRLANDCLVFLFFFFIHFFYYYDFFNTFASLLSSPRGIMRPREIFKGSRRRDPGRVPSAGGAWNSDGERGMAAGHDPKSRSCTFLAVQGSNCRTLA